MECSTSEIFDETCDAAGAYVDEFEIVNDEVEPVKVTRFAALYKTLTKDAKTSQSERREKFLEAIREKRNAVLDEKRHLLTDSAKVCDVEMTCDDDDDIGLEKVTKWANRRFRNRLTFTEWFVDIPTDLEQTWLVKFCPYGKRCLVVAEDYQTTSYNRQGKRMFTFDSNLPGGGYRSQRNKFTMLECLYSSKLKRFFVLDVLHWGCIPLRRYEAEFRFYWLQSRFNESPEIRLNSENGRVNFQLLDCIPASTHLISEQLMTIPVIGGQPSPYDGLLFYHKDGIYISAFTPLVTWLKPHMVTELFGVPVNPLYLENIPEGYTNLKEYVLSFLKNKKRRKPKNKETAECVEKEEAMIV